MVPVFGAFEKAVCCKALGRKGDSHCVCAVFSIVASTARRP